ncbi:MAG: heme NO-binding domain-containing protein [Polyangiaceae bacterium]|nr:heme NO-binding domain-containing protein [Polyangiaceae bacterium]
MQGVILIGIQRFVRERFGADFWRTVEAEANISGRLYLPSQPYPTSEVDAVIASVSRHSGMTVPLVLESVGDYIAPDILGAYAAMVEPQWTLLDVLLRSEAIVERAALKLGIKLANPPLQGRVGSNGEILLAYQNTWRICPLIKGLLRGLGANMDEPVIIDEVRCMSAGGSLCELMVKAERARPGRQRMPSMNGVGPLRTASGERVDRVSSLPPLPSSRPDARSTPGQTLFPPRADRNTPIPPRPEMPAGRPSKLPPAPDISAFDPDVPGFRRR